MKDSIDFGCHETVFAARKSGGKLAKKQNKHKNKRTSEVTT
jgi:hypothetical protein